MQIDLQAEAPQKKELLVKLLKEVYVIRPSRSERPRYGLSALEMLQSLLAAEGSGGQRGGSEGAACQISQCNHSTRVTARGINVQNVLHAINYDMPSTTTCHQLRHAINYDMPSTTTCHQLRHAINYDMPSTTTCHLD
ncbi:unnamed protein product, partial [Fusarium fujikuroi]